jgi:fibro-slime domain-containing protein
MGNIRPTLGDDGRPVFVGGGFHVKQQWLDAAGLPIYYGLRDTSLGDLSGRKGAASTGGIQDAASFSQWFRDVPGVNLSRPLTLTLVRDSTGSYVFDDKQDALYRGRGGFFPIDDELLGNPGGRPDHNFHFTYELHTEFTYDNSARQVFRFVGDDDVWVFINGKLVIDIGGVHAAVDQYVDLNRLGLEDGETYTLDFFFAERHRTQSNFRIETNLKLENLGTPTITGGYD